MLFFKLLCFMAVAFGARADDTPEVLPTTPIPEVNFTTPSPPETTSAPVAEHSLADGGIESSVPVSSTVEMKTSEMSILETTTPPDSENFTTPADSTTTTTAPVPSSTITNSSDLKKELVDKMSTQIIDILKHFQNPEPVGFPGQTVLEDPLHVPNTTTSLGGFVTGEFHNVTVHGLSNFTVEAVNTIIDQMEVYVMIKIKRLLIIGNCVIDTFIGMKSRGPFNITLTNVTAEGTVYLKVEPDGRVVANRSVSYLTYEDLSVDTTSGGMMQTTLSGAGVAILTALKPYILNQIDERINAEVNTLLKDTPKIPIMAELSPIDLAIVEGRKFISRNYEPFEIQKIFEHNSEFLVVTVGPVQVSGLSKFGRVGAVTVKMVNSTVQIGLRVVTGRLYGHCKFFYDFGKVRDERNGTADFTIEHLQFEAKISQSADLRKKPILEDLQLETGKILVRLDGGGKLDFFVELAMQFLPQMLRYVIINALEEPIKVKIQEEVLDKLNVDQIIQDQLPLFQSILMSAL